MTLQTHGGPLSILCGVEYQLANSMINAQTYLNNFYYDESLLRSVERAGGLNTSKRSCILAVTRVYGEGTAALPYTTAIQNCPDAASLNTYIQSLNEESSNESAF